MISADYMPLILKVFSPVLWMFRVPDHTVAYPKDHYCVICGISGLSTFLDQRHFQYDNKPNHDKFKY